MELRLRWRRHGISIRVLREQVKGAADRAAKQVSRSPSPEQRREVEREYLLASGNRYVGPIR